MDVEILARVQFAFTVAFHYIYPPLSIGLGLIMVISEGLFLKTKNPIYENMTRFFIRIFALIFGIGVATGIVMEFEFGTNWATYSNYVGDVFGSALAAEGVFAFALESGFLGILLFGWNRVSKVMHFVAALGVWLGSMFSAIWIVVANSWQQTPAGYHIMGEGLDARAEITDFWAMVFNPSSIERLTHVWLGSFLAGAFLMLSISAYYILKKRHIQVSKRIFVLSLFVALVSSYAQLLSGHASAEVVAEHQPAKLAAMEGHYDSLAVADLYVMGWVDDEAQETNGIAVPGGLSMLLDGFKGEEKVAGLNSFPKEDRLSNVNAVFQFYHIMVAIGMFLIAFTTLLAIQYFRGKLFENKWLLRIAMWSVLLPQIANQTGWFTAEMGRQPWVVYGLLRTSDALSKAVTANHVLFSLILFFCIYSVLFLLFLYLLNKKIKHGPEDPEVIAHSPRLQEIAREFDQ